MVSGNAVRYEATNMIQLGAGRLWALRALILIGMILLILYASKREQESRNEGMKILRQQDPVVG